MATYTTTTGTSAAPADYATLGIRATADIFVINGGYLRVDCDSRYGINGAVAASFGNITPSATLGGSIEFNSTKVRLIPFSSGSGTVPANDIVITQGSASGKLIGVYSAINAAPTAPAAAMPASGFIKIRQWNSVSFTAAALSGTGLTATASAADGPGWLEVVGVDGSTATINRLNTFIVRGDWYTFQGVTTSGNNTTTYQIPTNGSGVNYFPGVWVETGTGTGLYEFYPCAGSLTALSTKMATDSIRGKFCWISAVTGVVSFQNDGTNSTGGYLPPSGLKIRIPNIFFVNCVAAASVNVLPSATLATRYKFVTTAAGVIDINLASVNWNCNFQQPYAVTLASVGIMTQLVVQEIATPITWSHVGVGQEAANTQNALSMILCVAGGTQTNCTWTRASAIATSTNILSDVSGLTINNERTSNILLRTGIATTHVMTRVNNCTWTNTIIGNGTISLSTCSNLTFTTSTYYDGTALTTGTANPLYIWSLLLSCNNIKIDGLSFGGLILCQPYNGILNLGLAGNSNIRLRNLGTAASPLDMGDAMINATWATAATTTVTVTTVSAHNLKVGDIFYVRITGNTGGVTVGSKTVATVTSSTVFTFIGISSTINSTMTYYPTMTGQLVTIVAGHNGGTIKIQRCYVPHLRTNLLTVLDNSNSGLLLESVVGDYINAPTSVSLNQYYKQLICNHPLTVQSSVYGTHWLDYFTTGGGAVSGAAYTQATTTATITASNHGLTTGDLINVSASSNTSIIVLGQNTITAITQDTFTFACLTGATTGTISYTPLHGRIALTMNEKTTETANAYSIDSGGAAFTSSGGLIMPTIGDQVTFSSLTNFIGHTGFPIAEAVMAGGTIGNYDIKYSLDNGATYSNLYYPRAGGSGTSGLTTFTVTDGTGVAVGDYVWGTGIAPNTKVTLVAVNAITVDIANTGAVSGTIRFNHLPTDIVSNAAIGVSLKIRIKTSTTNTTAITSLYLFTISTPTSRGYTYPLDTINLSLSGLKTGSDIVVLNTGTSIERLNIDSNASTSFIYTYSSLGSVDIGVFKSGYVPFYIRNYSLLSVDAALPIAQVLDRNYA